MHRRRFPLKQRLPKESASRILTPHRFFRLERTPRDHVGWVVAAWLVPALVARIEMYAGRGRLFLVVPSPAALRSLPLPEALQTAVRSVPWWQRIGLAASLRKVHGVIPTRTLNAAAWKNRVKPAVWLDWMDPEESLRPAVE